MQFGRGEQGSAELFWQLRQAGFAHQVFVDAAGGFAAFVDGPDHQRLATAHIAGGNASSYGAALADALRRAPMDGRKT